jgi:hypothetical protein
MLLVMGVARWFDLQDRGALHFRKYRIVGASRILHRTAKVLCFWSAAVPVMQVNGRLAEIVMDAHAHHIAHNIAPFEVMGASPLSVAAYPNIPGVPPSR